MTGQDPFAYDDDATPLTPDAIKGLRAPSFFCAVVKKDICFGTKKTMRLAAICPCFVQ